MSRIIKPLILPAAFFLLFSAQECGPADKIDEWVSVQADGSVDVEYRHRAPTFRRILDSDPPPSLDAGWDSVHVGKVRNGQTNKLFLDAWRRFPPGGRMPETHAPADDALREWYVRFPSQLTQEVGGDTVLFHFERTYMRLPWSPMPIMEALAENLEGGDAELNALLEGLEESLDEKWKDSGILKEARESGDSATLRRYQREVRSLLEAEGPPVMERGRQLSEEWMYWFALSDLAFTIPAGKGVCREADPSLEVPVEDMVLDVLREPIPLPVLTWLVLLEELNIDPDPTVFPEATEESFDPWDDDFFEEMRVEKLERVRDLLLAECGLFAEGLMEFDRRFAWLSRRYEMTDGKMRDQTFEISLGMPGGLVETNADTVVDGRAEWEFSVHDLFEGEVRLEAVSRLVRHHP